MKSVLMTFTTLTLLASALAVQAQPRPIIARYKKLDCTPISQNPQFVEYKGALAMMSFDYLSTKPGGSSQTWTLDYIYQTKKGHIGLEKIGHGRMTETGDTFKGTWEEGDTSLNIKYVKEGKAPNTFELKGTVVIEQDFPFNIRCIATRF